MPFAIGNDLKSIDERIEQNDCLKGAVAMEVSDDRDRQAVPLELVDVLGCGA
jgi:hypothetical protein